MEKTVKEMIKETEDELNDPRTAIQDGLKILGCILNIVKRFVWNKC